MMESLDENVGRVVELLEKEKLLENTLIIFTSDNGGHCHLKVESMAPPQISRYAPAKAGTTKAASASPPSSTGKENSKLMS